MIRKHKGINQKTGRLKKGYRYSGKKLKSGLPEIVKITQNKKQKGGISFDENVNIVETKFNDCPKKQRVKQQKIKDSEGMKQKIWGCKNKEDEFITKNGFPCCKEGRFEIQLLYPEEKGLLKSKLKKPEKLSKKNKKIKLKYKRFKPKSKDLVVQKVEQKVLMKRPYKIYQPYASKPPLYSHLEAKTLFNQLK